MSEARCFKHSAEFTLPFSSNVLAFPHCPPLAQEELLPCGSSGAGGAMPVRVGAHESHVVFAGLQQQMAFLGDGGKG